MEQMDPDEVQKRGRKAKGQQDDVPTRMDSPIYTFNVDLTDSRKKRYTGRFTGKVPNLGDQVAIGQMKAAYLPQGSPADPNALAIAEMISYCHVVLTEKPDWWQPHLFWDVEPLQVVYNKCREAEDRFLGIDANGRRDAGGAEGDAQDSGAADHHAEGAVDGGVSASSQRREVLASHKT